MVATDEVVMARWAAFPDPSASYFLCPCPFGIWILLLLNGSLAFRRHADTLATHHWQYNDACFAGSFDPPYNPWCGGHFLPFFFVLLWTHCGFFHSSLHI